ncbi:hypothetical protein SAMN04487970_10079 [Paenibacillus tianmuensis]|uniref:Uncharacterized protein n=1 Tax=Paenibacillus tianmuensis TaxID=624147 RepID=A0A1G4QHM2_9BACL|nr:hypothetical protein SAMN04487970_10079 [Paenibacillus tianmuensis]
MQFKIGDDRRRISGAGFLCSQWTSLISIFIVSLCLNLYFSASQQQCVINVIPISQEER